MNTATRAHLAVEAAQATVHYDITPILLALEALLDYVTDVDERLDNIAEHNRLGDGS